MPRPSTRDFTTALTGTTATMSCPKPSNLSAGDLILAWVAAYKCTVSSAPSGFSPLLSIPSSNEMTAYIYGKVATGSEPATYDFTMTTPGSQAWACWSALCDNALLTNFPNDLIVDSATANNTGTSVTVASVAATSLNLLLGHAASRSSTGTITSNGSVMTPEIGNTQFTGDATRCARSFEEDVDAATGTRQFNVGDSTVHIAGLVALAPASVGGGGQTITTYYHDIQ